MSLFVGDCLDVLSTIPSQQIDMVYLDPPFFTQKKHKLINRDLTQEYQFDDVWYDIADYIHFLHLRLSEIRRVMKASACIFLHCDKSASHHIRLLLDQVFGAEHFVSEIIWTYKRWSNSQKSLLGSHQTIYLYSKSSDYKFNTLFDNYSETTNLDQILQKRERNAHHKTVYARSEDGEVILNGPKRGVPLSDTWEIPYLNPKAQERVGYPTQKPLALLERIIQLGSDAGDCVLDPFCGSGTTLVAASLLNRDYMGIDLSESAITLARERLDKPLRSQSKLMKHGRESYDNLPEYVKKLLEVLPVKPVQRNSGIDAICDNFINGQPVIVRVQREGEPLIEAARKLDKAGTKIRASKMILFQTSAADQFTFFDDDIFPQTVIVVKTPALLFTEFLGLTE